MKHAIALAALAAVAAVGSAHAAEMITNGGFESVLNSAGPSGPNYVIVNQSVVPGWHTTATDGQIELWGNGFLGVNTADGATGSILDGQSLFAEINANMFAQMYQDFTTPIASSIGYSFLHRGREGLDTVRFTVTYFGADNTFGTSDDQTLVSQLYSADNANDLGELNGWNVNAGSNAFVSVVNGTYRIGIESVSSVGGQSYGNLIDNVSVTADALPAAAVPEPTFAAVPLSGLGILAMARKRRR